LPKIDLRLCASHARLFDAGTALGPRFLTLISDFKLPIDERQVFNTVCNDRSGEYDARMRPRGFKRNLLSC
jgi:hypothetical protein